MGNQNKKKKGLKEKGDNVLKSLKEVEYFLNHWKKAMKGVKLYKLLKDK